MKKKLRPKAKKRAGACKILAEIPEETERDMLRRFAGLPPSLGNPVADLVASELRKRIGFPAKLKASEFCAHDVGRAADFGKQLEQQIKHATSFVGKRVVGVTVDKAHPSGSNNPISSIFEINLVFEHP